MDSKSISPKGSRGSSPRPGTNPPAPAAAGLTDLARALLPVLVHELNNQTQYLAALEHLVADGGALPGEGDGLAATAAVVAELGWCLGLCAGGLGGDLLQARRECDGLAPLVRLLGRALRREGRELAPHPGPLPVLTPAAGPDAVWGVGEWILGCARALEPGELLRWQVRCEGATLEVDCAAPETAALRDLARAWGGEPAFEHGRARLRLAGARAT